MREYNQEIIGNKNYTYKIIDVTKTRFIVQEISALIRRFVLQVLRRPSTIFSSIIQSLLWLILFGALFQNAPVGSFTYNIKYGKFLSSGIIVFTAFTGSLNAGLPLIFDREFGFLSRLLISPIISRDSILISSYTSIIITTMLQTLTIILCSLILFQYNFNCMTFVITIAMTIIIIITISSLSIGLSFTLPGHIEFLAFSLILNLPILFSSTALAPLSFMPYWLQIIASLNPLTYAIESIRSISIQEEYNLRLVFVKTIWGYCKFNQILLLFIILLIISFIMVKQIIAYRYD